ncbi:hypothetical protein K2173_024884 [Erythroxylum novogranatense]|uniref:C2 domain-containing protein n=1 Tax=Erythroxylum novogranatense TaxID=1862640 RepID=A0AAV8UCN1_9ROSI|nr:hypothetical protein K2173_024884 [Erythroxylum novogranatense]
MQSTYHRLEVTVISCEDLRINRRPVKNNTYVIVRTGPLNSLTTKIDTEGGSYPFWNEKLVMDMPIHERFVTFEVYRKGSSGNRFVGLARMPVTDFMGRCIPEGYLSFLSYRLRDAKDGRNGIINVSVRMEPTRSWSAQRKKKMHETSSSSASCTSKTLAMPSGESEHGEVVTGVPVWWVNGA